MTVKINAENGAEKSVTVDVTPGEASDTTMNKIKDAINSDPDRTAGEADYTVGSDANRFKVDNLRIRSINGGFQIKSIRVDGDESGFRNYACDLDGLSSSALDLENFGMPLPGLVRAQVAVADAENILADVNVPRANGTPAAAILASLSSALSAAGIPNLFDGVSLRFTPIPDGVHMLAGVYSDDPSLINAAYHMQITAEAAPEPASLALGSLAVGCGRRIAATV